jgi:hypothetical protein
MFLCCHANTVPRSATAIAAAMSQTAGRRRMLVVFTAHTPLRVVQFEGQSSILYSPQRQIVPRRATACD